LFGPAGPFEIIAEHPKTEVIHVVKVSFSHVLLMKQIREASLDPSATSLYQIKYRILASQSLAADRYTFMHRQKTPSTLLWWIEIKAPSILDEDSRQSGAVGWRSLRITTSHHYGPNP